MSEPNAGWIPEDIADDEEGLSHFTDALATGSDQSDEENNEQTYSELETLSEFSREPWIPEDASGILLDDDLYNPPSTSTGVLERSRGSRKASVTRAARSRYRSKSRVNFAYSRGRRGDNSSSSHSRQDLTRGNRSRGRSDSTQARGNRVRGRGRSHSLEYRRSPSPIRALNAEAAERLNNIMNNISRLYIRTPLQDPNDSYKP